MTNSQNHLLQLIIIVWNEQEFEGRIFSWQYEERTPICQNMELEGSHQKKLSI